MLERLPTRPVDVGRRSLPVVIEAGQQRFSALPGSIREIVRSNRHPFHADIVLCGSRCVPIGCRARQPTRGRAGRCAAPPGVV
jgi:hypothetical protein